MSSHSIMFTGLSCVSSPERVTVGKSFEVKLKTNLQPKSGQTFQCRCTRVFRPNNGYELPLEGKTPVAYKNGFFTFKLKFTRKELDVEGNPIKLPTSYPISFDLVSVTAVGDSVVALKDVHVTVE